MYIIIRDSRDRDQKILITILVFYYIAISISSIQYGAQSSCLL
jgi:hypothetical protein